MLILILSLIGLVPVVAVIISLNRWLNQRRSGKLEQHKTHTPITTSTRVRPIKVKNNPRNPRYSLRNSLRANREKKRK